MKTILVKYVRDIKPIQNITQGDWIDLRAGETVELAAGEYRMIPLGVAMELPKGYEALVIPRSSTFSKWGVLLVNSVGLIDESYCGDGDEWHMPVLAMRKTTIHKNDRICQFRIIQHMPETELVRVKHLGNENRGGFGSTGEN